MEVLFGSFCLLRYSWNHFFCGSTQTIPFSSFTLGEEKEYPESAWEGRIPLGVPADPAPLFPARACWQHKWDHLGLFGSSREGGECEEPGEDRGLILGSPQKWGLVGKEDERGEDGVEGRKAGAGVTHRTALWVQVEGVSR